MVVRILIAALLIGFNGTVAAADAGTGSARHENGRKIYNYRCYFCHGYSGDAKTLTSTYLDPPPRDFTQTGAAALDRQRMIEVVTHGKPGTAMHGFARLLNETEIATVIDFVRLEFMQEKRLNTQYHTAENGWPRHERYRDAFPFATGEIPLDRPWQQLPPAHVRGKQLYLTSCITCHDRARVEDEGVVWSKQSISYPRNNYSHTEIDAVSSASIYVKHDIAPAVADLSTEATAGKKLWQQNCAFCHAADGSGENWIGSFLEPKPRDLTDASFMRSMTRDLLRQRIRDGLANTSMPAWKDVLDQQQINQIISYIDEAFYPLGEPVTSQF